MPLGTLLLIVAMALGHLAPTATGPYRQRAQDLESYRGARSALTRGDVDRALALLRTELERGFDVGRIMGDAIWNDLRRDARFKELVREHATGSESRIAPYGEPGEALVWEATLVDADGAPVAGAMVYAYQTDHTGVYSVPDDDSSNPRLYGYAASDDGGRVVFHTVRPQSYPDGNVPQHIHYVVEAGDQRHSAEMLFEDDPLLTDQAQARAEGREWPIGQVTLGEQGTRVSCRIALPR